MPKKETSAVLDGVTETLPLLARIDEVAELLRVSSRTVRRMIDGGRLASYQNVPNGGSRVLIPRRAVADYLSSIAR